MHVHWLSSHLPFLAVALERPVLKGPIQYEIRSVVPVLLFLGIMFFFGLLVQDKFFNEKR